jgi:tetratricopeptide (TPR) repeat protein
MPRALLCIVACLLLAFGHAAAGADASTLFAEGERAFSAGEFREALRLFEAAREAGSTGPSSYYNIGVSQYRLGDFAAAEATFAALAAEFPAMRELAEYNRGLALRASGNVDAARIAFSRAQSSSDDKIAALANAQLAEIGGVRAAREPSWSGYFAGGLGYDDNVALFDEQLLPSADASSPLAEVYGLLSRDFGSRPLWLDFTGYAVGYSDVPEFDQTVLRLSLTALKRLGSWTLLVGPTLGRSTFDGEGFEELVGADVRLRRSFRDSLVFEARALYDDSSAGAPRFAYLEGSRRQVRLSLEHTGLARIRGLYQVERDDRADPGVSPSRERWSLLYLRPLSAAWSVDARLSYRTSRFRAASVPRRERLQEVSLAARREIARNWEVGAEYQWFDNDSTNASYTYDGQRLILGLSKSFSGS